MGWTEGEGLGKTRSGEVDPLTLDIKMDKKGIILNSNRFSIFIFEMDYRLSICILTLISRNFSELRLTQCGNFNIFLSLRFYVKSNYLFSEPPKIVKLQFQILLDSPKLISRKI